MEKDNHYKNEIDLTEFFGTLWKSKIKIVSITIIFSLISIVYTFSLPNLYKAEVLLAPAQSSQGDLSRTLGQLGGLAAVAGINIDNSEVNDARVAQEIMKSWSFIDKFISDNELSVEVYAAESWKKDTNELQIDRRIYNSKNERWLVENDSNVVGPPTSWGLYKEFSKRLQVSQDSKTGLIAVSIEYYSPFIAKKWVDMYVRAINTYMQQRQIQKVTKNIEYLKTQIDKTPVMEMRDAFYSVMEEQIKNKMLAEASPDYVFVAVSPSMVPEKKSQPSRALIVLLASLFGLMFSSVLVSVLHYVKKPLSADSH